MVKVVCAALGRPEKVVGPVVDICAPLSCDIRDIVFIVHRLSDENEKGRAAFGRQVLGIWDTMKTHQISRVNELSRTAAALLLGVYIGSRTSIASDLRRFARTVQKKGKEPRMYEDHDTIPVERAYALAKAIICGFLGEFQTDFSLNLQLQRLVELGLVELRGDIYGDPRVKCLASEQEATSVARVYEIPLHEYLAPITK
jgi:hypothetical protein